MRSRKASDIPLQDSFDLLRSAKFALNAKFWTVLFPRQGSSEFSASYISSLHAPMSFRTNRRRLQDGHGSETQRYVQRVPESYTEKGRHLDGASVPSRPQGLLLLFPLRTIYDFLWKCRDSAGSTEIMFKRGNRH
jgi:hypothetical protein